MNPAASCPELRSGELNMTSELLMNITSRDFLSRGFAVGDTVKHVKTIKYLFKKIKEVVNHSNNADRGLSKLIINNYFLH